MCLAPVRSDEIIEIQMTTLIPLQRSESPPFVRASETEQTVPADHLQHDLEHGDPGTIQVSTGWSVDHAPKDREIYM